MATAQVVPPIPEGFEVDTSIPTIPDGFEVESSASTPPIPPGFEPESSPQSQPAQGMGDLKQAESTMPVHEPSAPRGTGFVGRLENLVKDWEAENEAREASLVTPLVTLPKPENQGVGTGIARGVISATESLTTPESVGLLGSIAGAPAAIARAASAGFSVMMGKGAAEAVKQGMSAETSGEKAEAFTNAAISALMAGAAGKHAASRPSKGGAFPEGRGPEYQISESLFDVSRAQPPPVTTPSPPSPASSQSTGSTAAAPTGAVGAGAEAVPSRQKLTPESQKSEAERLATEMLDNQLKDRDARYPADPPSVQEATKKAEELAGEPARVSGKQEPIAPLSTEGPDTVGGMPIGPGKMTAGELPEGTTTGLKRATVDTERLDRGAEPIPTPERLKRDEIVRQAEDAVDADATLAPSIVSRVVDRGERAISHTEAAALLVERQRLKNERTSWEERRANGEDPAVVDKELGEIEKQMDRLDQAQRSAGSEWSDVGRMYQNMIKEDFTLDAIERKARAAKQGPLTPEELATAKDQAARYEAQQKEVEALRAQEAQFKQQAARTQVLESTIADLQGKQKFGREVYDIAQGVVNRWKADAEAAHKSLRQRLGRTSAGVDPTIVLDVAKIVRAWIGEFGLKRIEANERLLNEFGDNVKPYLDKAWEKAQQLIGKERAPESAKKLAKGGMRKKGEKTSTQVGERAKLEAETGFELRGKTAYEAVRAAINEGAVGEGPIMDRALEILKPSYPELTLRQLDEKFTGYGEAKTPSQERTAVQLRKMNQLRQMLLKIQDLQEKGKAPRFGTARDKPDADVRLRIKELRDAVEKFSKDVPDTPEMIASREATAVRAKENAIERLDRQLQGIEQEIKRTPREQSQKVQDLQAQLDAMRELKRELDAGPQKSPEQKALEARIRAAEKTRDELDARLQGKPRDPKSPAPTSPALETIQAEIGAMREQLREMEAPPKKPEAVRQIEQLEKTKERLDEVLSGTRPPNAPKDWTPLSSAAADLKAEVLAMQELAAQMRRDAKPKTDPRAAKEKAEIKALEKAIDEYARRVRESDFTAKGPQQGPPSSKAIADLRAIRDSRRSMYKAAVKAGKPVLTPEQRYNKTRLAAVESAIKAGQERIARSDFAPRTKKPPPAKIKSVLDAEAKLEKIRQEVKQGEEKFRLANRTALQKAKDRAELLLQSARGIILGSDIGVLTRQGLFAWSRPTKAIPATVEAFKAAVSPSSMARWEIEVRDRVINGEAAAPKRKAAGLQLSDTISHPEELVVTRLLSRIPDFKVGGKTIKLSEIGRTLERFQTTFINAVRADLFDSAIKQGMTPEELKLRANFINSATGRSNIKHVPRAMSMIFTSPRYETSRWEMLAQPVRNIGALARAGVKGELDRAALSNLKDMGVTIAGIYGIYKLAETSGYSVNWNPTSSDFLKMRKGDEVWDVSAGLAPRIRDVMRLYVAITHPNFRNNIGKDLTAMLLRSINPALKAPVEQIGVSAQRARGVEEPKLPFTGFRSDEEREGWIALAPLIVQSTNQSLEEGAGAAVFTAAREFVGSSIHRYPKTEDQPFPPQD